MNIKKTQTIKVKDIASHKTSIKIGCWYEFPQGYVAKFWGFNGVHYLMYIGQSGLTFWCSATILPNKRRENIMRYFNLPLDATIRKVRSRDYLFKIHDTR